MPTVFLTHPPEALSVYYGACAVAALKAIADVRFNTAGRELSQSELARAAQDCDAIISYRQTPATAELFNQLPNLVAFLRCAVDVRNIDIAAASAQGILVTQASAGFVGAVAEMVIGLMIAVSRGIVAYAESYHAGRVPAAKPGSELRGLTAGVIGYGRISRYLCDLCAAIGLRVLVADPYVANVENNVTKVELKTLLAQSDFVIPLAVATAETENLMDADAFEQMKPGAFFINVSRGNLVDEAALLRALENGKLTGCALDVGRDPDQMPTPALAAHPKVIATPHIGGLTPQSVEHQAIETVRQLEAILRGEPPIGSLNTEKASRLARLRSARSP